MKIHLRRVSVIFLILTFCVSAYPQQASLMQKDFQNPPESAKPRVWWHWMSGNVSKEGITADLEWMHRVNIGGMQMFDGDLGVARYIDKPVIWMTPEWKDAFHHAGAEADRLGLEMSMAASGGWSETAGPWVKPEAAMKKVVWSETRLSGPSKFDGRLAAPPHVNGPFQGIAIVDFPSSQWWVGRPTSPVLRRRKFPRIRRFTPTPSSWLTVYRRANPQLLLPPPRCPQAIRHSPMAL